jgi:Acyl-CoA dehydrogenase, N-terminal domain/Acyl-CoA dehydrogenase, middle domain
VELDLGPEIAQFRAELRDWIAAEAPPALAGLADWNMPLTAGGRTAARIAEAEAHPAYAEWEARLAARRLICPQWPEEFGGQGMDAVRVAVLNEEFYRAGVPRVTRGMGEWLVAPSVIVHGTAEQQAYFLPRILSGEDTYCQGFSEPGHGSDLAAVETRGVVDGDELVITGQKVWTSGAARATRMFLLCRTDPDVPKHAGLSYVLETRAAIGAHLPPFASAHNPLDVTGFGTLANLSASKGPLTVVDHALDAAVQDPNLDFVLFAGLTPWPATDPACPGRRPRGPRSGRGGCWRVRACRWYRAGWPRRPERQRRSPGRSGCRWR